MAEHLWIVLYSSPGTIKSESHLIGHCFESLIDWQGYQCNKGSMSIQVGVGD